MVLIIGGAFQGKLEYAISRFGLVEDEIFRCSYEDPTCPAGKRAVYEVDKWVLALIRANKNIPEEAQRFAAANKDAIVIASDISCGVVPIDAQMRLWREESGRFLGKLAREAGEVVRMYCGIATKVK